MTEPKKEIAEVASGMIRKTLPWIIALPVVVVVLWKGWPLIERTIRYQVMVEEHERILRKYFPRQSLKSD